MVITGLSLGSRCEFLLALRDGKKNYTTPKGATWEAWARLGGLRRVSCREEKRIWQLLKLSGSQGSGFRGQGSTNGLGFEIAGEDYCGYMAMKLSIDLILVPCALYCW